MDFKPIFPVVSPIVVHDYFLPGQCYTLVHITGGGWEVLWSEMLIGKLCMEGSLGLGFARGGLTLDFNYFGMKHGLLLYDCIGSLLRFERINHE